MNVPKVTPLAVDRVVAAIRDWLADRPGHFSPNEVVQVYTQEQWRGRGETMCADAAATLLLQEGGAFRQLVNFDWLGKEADDLYEGFIDLLNCHGYMHELGHSWTLHLYAADAR